VLVVRVVDVDVFVVDVFVVVVVVGATHIKQPKQNGCSQAATQPPTVVSQMF